MPRALGGSILRVMTPPPTRIWLLPLLAATVGIYLLFVALAVGELRSGHWALYLIAAVVACFVLAAATAARGVRHVQRH